MFFSLADKQLFSILKCGTKLHGDSFKNWIRWKRFSLEEQICWALKRSTPLIGPGKCVNVFFLFLDIYRDHQILKFKIKFSFFCVFVTIKLSFVSLSLLLQLSSVSLSLCLFVPLSLCVFPVNKVQFKCFVKC